MRQFILMVLVGSHALLAEGAQIGEGRWEGSVNVPGNEFEVIVDLARNGAGTWIGSMIVPGMGLKGAPLADIVVTDSEVKFSIPAFGRTPAEKAEFDARIDAGGAMSGDFRQGGNTAGFALRKTAAAQVELPPRSTAVAKVLEGKWVGDYELGGYPRHITISLANRAGAPASVEFVVVGKKTTAVPVDLITQDEDSLRIQSSEYGINFEGKLHKDTGELKGIYEQGPFDLPLTLHRPG